MDMETDENISYDLGRLSSNAYQCSPYPGSMIITHRAALIRPARIGTHVRHRGLPHRWRRAGMKAITANTAIMALSHASC